MDKQLLNQHLDMMFQQSQVNICCQVNWNPTLKKRDEWIETYCIFSHQDGVHKLFTSMRTVRFIGSLVGGFNPSEKYDPQIGSSPQGSGWKQQNT